MAWKTELAREKIDDSSLFSALRTGCPVIPMFTVNIREAFRTVGLFRNSLFRRLYQKTRLPLVPIYGGLPVKLRTVVGEPVEYDPMTCSAEELRDRCRLAIQQLIEANQKRPGSVLRALKERICVDCCASGQRPRQRRRRRDSQHSE